MPSLARLLPPALSKPRFRLFAAGQAVSIVGSWIQQVALAWLVYRLTGSVFYLGLAGFLLQIPHLFIAPVAGFVVDRVPRVKALVAINVTLAALAGLLATLALSHVTDVRPYLAVALLIGAANACESPTRQSLIGAIVEDRALLPSAIGLNSVLFNGGRLVGPAIAGVLLLHLSEGVCFLINAASFAGIVGALVAMRLPDAPMPRAASGGGLAVRETLAHLLRLPAARHALPLASTMALFSVPLNQLMPSIAVAFFGGDQSTVGLLLSASGLGAMLAALTISLQSGHRLQLRLVQAAPLVGGLALLGFSQSRTLWLSLPLLAVVGASQLSTSVSTNTLLQQSVDDAWRGRVIGLYFMCFLGLAPIGNLLAGTVASRFGLGVTLAMNGALLAIVAAAMQVRLRARPGEMQALKASVGMGRTSDGSRGRSG